MYDVSFFTSNSKNEMSHCLMKEILSIDESDYQFNTFPPGDEVSCTPIDIG